MRYVAVEWLHDDEEPILLYSELDQEGWEVRKVEVYRSGAAHYAEAGRRTGSTLLGEMPVPSLQEIAADPQFRPREITREEFEQVWQQSLRQTPSLAA